MYAMAAAIQQTAAGLGVAAAAVSTLVALRRAGRRSDASATSAEGRVRVVTREELSRCLYWPRAFAGQRKDGRYYEIVEETILQGFDYRYFVVEDARGEVRAVQPFFLLDQDLLQGAGPAALKAAEVIRRVFPKCLKMRTLMVGCAAGEGHLDDGTADEQAWVARMLREAALRHARESRAGLIVLKEFHAAYRKPLAAFVEGGFTRVPSLPMTRLNINYTTFDEYMSASLSKVTRKGLRRKFRDAEELTKDNPIELQVVTDVSPHVDEVYPLYLQVYQRSSLQFEKLTKEFMCQLGRRMPDKARFFIWRQGGKAVAFSLCLLNGDTIYDEYLGLDYSVALDLHLYFYTFRDIVAWAMQHGCRWYASSALNYDPKLHFRCDLVPLDLYVAHTNRLANAVLRKVLPYLEPTRGDKTLRQFRNYADLRADAPPSPPTAPVLGKAEPA